MFRIRVPTAASKFDNLSKKCFFFSVPSAKRQKVVDKNDDSDSDDDATFSYFTLDKVILITTVFVSLK